MPNDKLELKLKHAEFHFVKMKGVRPDDFEFQCHFTAYLSALRSVVVYIEKWLRDGGRLDSWLTINRWESQYLTANQLERWKLLTRLRNTDIHEEPIIPDKEYFTTISITDILSVAPPFSFQHRFNVKHPVSGKIFEIVELAETGLEAARKLIDDQHTL